MLVDFSNFLKRRLPASVWDIVLMEPARKPPGMYQKPGNNGINYRPQLVIAGFLDHQQYWVKQMFGWCVLDVFFRLFNQGPTKINKTLFLNKDPININKLYSP